MLAEERVSPRALFSHNNVGSLECGSNRQTEGQLKQCTVREVDQERRLWERQGDSESEARCNQ